MYTLTKSIWIQEKIPEEWSKTILGSILRKEMPQTENYRDIALINITFKILLMTIKNNLRVTMNEIVEYQTGFQRGNRLNIYFKGTISGTSRTPKGNFLDFKQDYNKVKKKKFNKNHRYGTVYFKTFNNLLGIKVEGKVSNNI